MLRNVRFRSMKTLLFVLSLLLSNLSFGQISLDVGARKEIARFSAYASGEYVSPTFTNIYLNDSYFFKLNFEKNRWIFSTEFSSLNKSLEINANGGYTDTDYVYGGGPPSGSSLTIIDTEESWYYNSDLKLNYLGVRLGVDRSFLEGDFNVLIGGSVNCDFLVGSKEDVDFLRTTTRTTSNWNGVNTTTTYSDIIFTGARFGVNSAYLNFGLNAALRYNFNSCYVDAFINNALTWYQRYRDSNDYFTEYKEMALSESRYNFEYGLRIGFYLTSKNSD